MKESIRIVSELLEKDSQRGAMILAREEMRAVIKLLEFCERSLTLRAGSE